MRTHNEWFRTVLSKRKSCPTCKTKLPEGESIWSWGEYGRGGKWYTVVHFCFNCFDRKVRQILTDHVRDCGCSVNFVGYRGEKLPRWFLEAFVEIIKEK